MDEASVDLRLLKKRLTGDLMKNLLLSKSLSKYRVAKDCGLSWRTIHNWIKGKSEPSKDNALMVAKYLGLIPPSEIRKQELKKEIDEIGIKQAELSKKLNQIN